MNPGSLTAVAAAASLGVALSGSIVDSAGSRGGFSPDQTATEVTFTGVGGLQLRGTLLMPATPSAAPAGVPAVLLLPGSGPTDRNGNQPPALMTDLLRQIAEGLAAAGVASFRFDKRAAHAYAAIWPKDPAAVGPFFSYENFIGDATAAYRRLRSAEGVDTARVGILGHSEGGLYALQIASDLAATPERPAGLVLAATAGRTLDVVIREQLTAALARQKADASARDSFLAHLDRGVAAIKAGEPAPNDLPAGLRPIFNPSAQVLLRAYFAIDPARLAEAVRGPVLVLQGERDAQVSVERDAPLLEAALRRRTPADVELAIVPGAGHSFKTVAAGAGPAAGFTGSLAAGTLDAILGWSKRAFAPAR